MKKIFTASILSLFASAAMAQDFTAAGASSARTLYVKWAESYGQKNNIKLSYQAAGSAEGIKLAKSKAVDFGATDFNLSAEESRSAKLISIPSAVTGIVPVVNLPEAKSGELRLSGEVLAEIYMRKITKWNDAAIAALNPGVNLPKIGITVVARSDGSGATYNFTEYLSTVSQDWKNAYGRNMTVKWAADVQQVKGSDEMSAAVRQTAGAIGYIDYKFAVQDKLGMAQLKNRDGKFVAPNGRRFASAVQNSAWTKGQFDDTLINRAGGATWPITAGAFMLLPSSTNKPQATIALLKFISWTLAKGDHLADGADFVALPHAVQAQVFAELTKITDNRGQPLQWSPAL
ncbi:phosphate ABC transporter substrate-binding protein PstS [Massilia sp. W12]|uniref:phosphate ABC transporter substrate-binding protein PstS n=1 Tax=Massilia sp. W12 TaxID=3126507 RepID=UPI0030CBE2FD